ncbi:hypothetical protein K501DRAFT_330605 [Backusella circina FSU 941]|nr:hypothetical protein K501DRAFT_330605 [Backusella circina FSU 941]
MPTSRKDGRRLTGYIADANPVIDTDQEVPTVHGEDNNNEADHEQEEEEVDDTSSELSVPDAEIDFDMVYALYTFAATVEGQASIVKGDALTLLDDTNSYWWLVKVLKTAEIGYIPAEIIETPFERLARLNSHRNAQLTRPSSTDITIKITRTPSKQQRRVTLSRAVQFQSQIMFNYSDDEEEYQVEYDHWQMDRHEDESDGEESTSTLASDIDEDPYHFYHKEQDEDEYPVFDSPVNEEFDSHLTPLKDTADNNNTKLKIYAGHHFEEYKEFNINTHTTTTELIETAIDAFDIYDVDERDYYLGVQSMSGDDYTMIPTDRPLDIYQSLTNNTPMPNLKRAKRISLMMSGSSSFMNHDEEVEESARFYLYSKPRRMEDDGEIQVKVSLESSHHKLIKIPPTTPVIHATSFLLERFHVLDGVAVGSDRDSLNMGSQDVITYQLYLYDDKKEYALPSSATLSEVLGNQMPPIQYRRHSNLNRLSISISINPPHENETYFILRPIQKAIKQELKPTHQEEEEEKEEEETHVSNENPVHHRAIRHDTPMPRREHASTPEPIADKPPQITFTSESPIDFGFDSPTPQDIQQEQQEQQPDSITEITPKVIHQQEQSDSTSEITPKVTHQQEQPVLTTTTTPTPKVIQQEQSIPATTEAHNDIQQQTAVKRPESTIYHHDFGMRDLMILIREKSRPNQPKPRKSTIGDLRGEITHVFKDTHGRLDQLEKELDDILAIAINMP